MKEIIKVELKTRRTDFVKCETDLLAVGLFSDVKGLDKLNAELNRRLDGAIERLIALGDFKGKEGTNAILYTDGKIGAKRLMLVGLGEKKPPVKAGAKYLAPHLGPRSAGTVTRGSLDTVRKAAANAANKAVLTNIPTLSLALHRAFGGRFDLSAMGRAMAEGAYFGSYRYDEYVTESEEPRLNSLKVELIDADPAKARVLESGLAKGVIIGLCQSYARTLTNRPANIISPAKLAATAQELTRDLKTVSCTILDEKQLEAQGMGGLLAVGSGSQNKPRLIVLKYNPAGKTAISPRPRGGGTSATGAEAKLPRIALVGKAITFDSGGISIKPATDMDEMKLDKTGGIAVLSTIKAAAELKLPLSILGIIPSAENLPSGTSYRPGDIISTYSGKTVEVLNTDAEGRMILCDALAYAAKQKCDIIIDIATLTGACMVALGTYMAGLFGNDEKLIKQLQKAAQESGEKVWPMPSTDEYAAEMKSKIADLKNIGSKWGGACTGAAFLRQFVGDAKWAHLDIAGVDIFKTATEYTAEGSSGFGVRLLTTYLMDLSAGRKK